MNLIKIEDNKNNIIKKSNELVKSKYSLSEHGIKIVSMLISMIKVADVDFQEYHLSVKDFANSINSKSNDIYKQVDSITDELMSKPFKILDEKFNWCYYAKYKKDEAFVTLKIAPELKPHLLELQGKFLEYNIKDILSLKSTYVIRLYELFIMEWKQYKYYNPNAILHTFKLEIDELRELFEIPESFKYNDIKRHIINKAQKQFKEKTNIQFDYEEKKIGRKVEELIIILTINHQGSNFVNKTLIDMPNEIIKHLAMVNNICGYANLFEDNATKFYDDGTFELMRNDGSFAMYKNTEHFLKLKGSDCYQHNYKF